MEAFNSSPLGSGRYSQVQDDSIATKLDAASLELSFEEDLALTRQIIMDHQERSATVSKEQFIQQMEELVTKPAKEDNLPLVAAEIVVEKVDISVPYDAAARLAYESLESKKDISFDAFEAQYLVDAVALVKSKQSQKEGDVTPPAVASTTTTEETTMAEKKPEVKSVAGDANAEKKKKILLQAVVSWLWKQVSRK